MSASGSTMTCSSKRRGPASSRVPSAARWALKPRETNEIHRAHRARGARLSPDEHLSILPAVLRAQ